MTTSTDERAAARRASVPQLAYPPDLPITARREELVAALREHQVLVVAGETGSGKSTQLPKLCLEAGRGVHGMVGHTQPRRIAARAVAERVASEMGTGVGELVGYQVRFTDKVSGRSLIKVMTDGILLNELQRDRDLTAYDTLIIDEAHERSLNIDFILGYLTTLLPRRPDLHLVVTSATIDTARFAAHFDDAPVIEVSGRTYPVELRYRPLGPEDQDGEAGEDEAEDEEDGDEGDHGPVAAAVDEVPRAEPVDVVDGVCDAVTELITEGPGDVLVFASGERDIRDYADALRALHLTQTEVLPLYARLSAAEQHRVFSPHRGRRVVIATNIAETSLTVPGIRTVVDPGLARISRYGRRSKVQRLPIERVSRASADQRAGRCGRLGPGICIRLYSERDYDDRPAFTEPEILRTNLASVVLQMTALGLGDVASFPFVEPPDRRSVSDAVQLLMELDALVDTTTSKGGTRPLTKLGRRLARLPLDPRLGRMVLEAERLGCVHEVMVIVAALSVQDPRERPREQRITAQTYHDRFTVEGSDFLTYLLLWRYVREQQHQLSSGAFRRRCRQEFLHHARLREWQDVYAQLRRVVRDLGIAVSSAPQAPVDVHRAILTGLLSAVGMRDKERRDYLGTRSTRFALSRSSAAAEVQPAWIMAAELVETNRLWAHGAGQIEPEWIEELAGDDVTRTYGEPRWQPRRGAATTTERVTFRGLPIVTGRRVDLARVDPDAARDLFVRHALVAGEWAASHAFLERNQETVTRAGGLEERARRRGIVDPVEALTDFYQEEVPSDIRSGRDFDRWWSTVREEGPTLLDVPLARLLDPDIAAPDEDDFPDVWQLDGLALPLTYRFEPGHDEDGVTVEVPLGVVHRLDRRLDWLVPGLRHELVETLVRGLPKDLRRALVPATETAAAVLARVGPADGPLLPVLSAELTRRAGARISTLALARVELAPHLRMRYQVSDGDGDRLAEGDDLGALQDALRERVAARVARESGVATSGATSWRFGTLPAVLTSGAEELAARGYPTLVDEGTTAGVRVVATPAEQTRAMWTGTRRLLRLAVDGPLGLVARRLTDHQKLALTLAPHPDVAAAVEDAATAVLDALLAERGGPVRDETAWEGLRREVRAAFPDRLLGATRTVAEIADRAAALREQLTRPASPALDAARRDVAAQLGRLVFDGFVAATGLEQLTHLPRYLEAMQVRLDGLRGGGVPKDTDRMLRVVDLEEEYRLARELRGPRPAPDLASIRWQLEELRVSLFAQSLGTAQKVSEQRVRSALRAARPT